MRTRDDLVRHLYATFLDSLPAGGRILDLGCGPGRDAKAFTDLEFDVTGTDGSAAIVELASRNASCPIHHMTFDEIPSPDIQAVVESAIDDQLLWPEPIDKPNPSGRPCIPFLLKRLPRLQPYTVGFSGELISGIITGEPTFFMEL